MNNKRTKRVVGSAEIVTDSHGNLIATNFRAYKRNSRTIARTLDTIRRRNFTLYEYTEHYIVALRVEKDMPINNRELIAAVLDAASEIKSRD